MPKCGNNDPETRTIGYHEKWPDVVVEGCEKCGHYWVPTKPILIRNTEADNGS